MPDRKEVLREEVIKKMLLENEEAYIRNQVLLDFTKLQLLANPDSNMMKMVGQMEGQQRGLESVIDYLTRRNESEENSTT